MRHLLLSCLFAALLAGCSAVPPQPPLDSLTRSWQENASWLQQQRRWEIKGKIGIRQDQQLTSATLSWHQQYQDYQIFMSGPLGQGAVNIQGNDRGIVLKMSGEESYYATSPELLLQQHLGWSLPLSSLDHWVKGLPSPDSPYRKKLNAGNLLDTLEQDSWKINFRSYHTNMAVPLPKKIVLTRGETLRVTLVVKEWNLSSAEG